MAQAADFIAVELVPCELKLGIAAELVILKRMYSVKFQDRYGPVGMKCGWVSAIGSCGCSNGVGLWEMGMGAGSYGCRHCMDLLGASPEVNGLR